MGRYISKYMGRHRLLYAIGLFITCMLLFPIKVRATEEYLAPPEKIGVIQAGQLYPTADYFIPEKHRFLDAGDMVVTNVDEALYQGMRARQTKIDVSAYRLTYSNWGEVWSRTIDNHEDLFYVEWTSGAIGDGTYIKSINVTYDTNYSQEDVEVFYEVCSTILEKMPDGLTAQQKTLYLHDYLVTHCEYDMTFSKFDAYNALVEGSSVCQGYALAYAYLCKRVGVEAYLVTSIENDHAWDLVVLDGTYYYVDCTWDDPVGDWYEAYCRHSNYLRSREGMVSTNHQNTRLDWTSTVLGNVSQIGVTSTMYDSYYWSEVISAMPFIGTVQAYAMQNDCSNVYLRTNSGTVTKVPIGRTAKWYVWGSTSSFYSSSYISMAAVSNDFYFSTEFAIYKMSADGTIELFYELTPQEKEKGYLFGIVSGKDALVYSVGTKGWNNQDFVKTQLMIGPPMVSIDFDANGGFGTMSGIDVERGSCFEFPACGFTAPEGMVFSGWAVNGTIYAQGASMIVNENLSIQAVWKIFVDTSSPKMVSVTAGESSVTVTWKANVGVPGYVVFRKTDSGRWTKLNEVTGTNYLDATVTAGHTYAYTVRGINDAGKYVTSYDTVGMSVKLEETIDKSSPVILSVTAGNDGVAVTWKANVGVPGYVVFRKTDSGRWTKLNEVTGTNYLDATVTAGHTYAYTVRGINDAGKYVTSYDIVGMSVKLEETIDKSSPVILSVTAGNDGVVVTWRANAGVPKYAVFRKTDSGRWTKLNEVTGTNYLDATVTAGHTYAYTVRGINDAGKYVTSYDIVGMSVKLEETIDKSSPVILSVTAGNDGVVVTWRANAGVPKYAVFRKTDSGRWTKLNEVTGTNYLDATVTAGHTYAYTVRGINDAGKYVTSYDTIGKSVVISASLDKSSPILLSATADDNGVTVSWKANGGVESYAVFRKTVGGNWVKVQVTAGTISGIQASAGETCYCLDDTAQSGVTYIYTVRGMNAAGKYVTSYDVSGVTVFVD